MTIETDAGEAQDMLKERKRKNGAKEALPVDKGWAWCVAFVGGVTFFLVSSTMRTMGVILVEISRAYDRNYKDTTSIVTIDVLVSTLISPLVPAFVNVYTVQKVTFFGGIVLFSSFFLSAFAKSFEFLYFSHGLLLGLGKACVFMPPIILISQYFERRRSLATSMFMAGGPLSCFVIPPLIQYFVDTFGIHGAFLLYSAILLHVCAAAMLMRPTSYYDNTKTSEVDCDCEKVCGEKTGENRWSIQSDFVLSSSKQENKHTCSDKMRKACSCSNISHHAQQKTKHSDRIDDFMNRISTSARDIGAVSFVELPGAILFPPKDIIDKEDATEKKTFTFLHNLFYSLDWSLWKDPTFLIMSFSISVMKITVPMVFLIVPAHGQDMGHSSMDCAMILFWSGIPDLCSRLLAGYINDVVGTAKRRLYLYITYTLTLSLLWVILAAVDSKSYIFLLIIMMLIASFFGAFLSTCFIVIGDTCGMEKLSSGLSFSGLIDIVPCTAIPIFMGYFRDVYGHWNAAMYASSLITFIAGGIVLVNHLVLEFRSYMKNCTRLQKSANLLTKQNP